MRFLTEPETNPLDLGSNMRVPNKNTDNRDTFKDWSKVLRPETVYSILERQDTQRRRGFSDQPSVILVSWESNFFSNK